MTILLPHACMLPSSSPVISTMMLYHDLTLFQLRLQPLAPGQQYRLRIPPRFNHGPKGTGGDVCVGLRTYSKPSPTLSPHDRLVKGDFDSVGLGGRVGRRKHVRRGRVLWNLWGLPCFYLFCLQLCLGLRTLSFKHCYTGTFRAC